MILIGAHAGQPTFNETMTSFCLMVYESAGRILLFLCKRVLRQRTQLKIFIRLLMTFSYENLDAFFFFCKSNTWIYLNEIVMNKRRYGKSNNK